MSGQNDWVHYPDCQDKCPALDDMQEERDCWARAADVMGHNFRPRHLFGGVRFEEEIPLDEAVKLCDEADLAAAYALAELGDNWRGIYEED